MVQYKIDGEINNEELDKLAEYVKKELEIHNIIDSTAIEPTEEPNIEAIKVPDKAYTDDGELKPEYKEAYKKIIEKKKEEQQMKKSLNKTMNELSEIEEIEEEKCNENNLEKMEIADSTSMDIKYILNDIFDYLGIIQSIKIRISHNQTGKLLQILAKHSKELENYHLGWTIKEYCENDLELTLEAIKYYGE